MNFSPQERVLIWVLASLLGLIPATIAHRKGRSFAFWWFYGAMIFVVALLHSLWIRPVVKTPSYQPPAPAQIPEPTLPEGIKK